jgi:hypothetical protein
MSIDQQGPVGVKVRLHDVCWMSVSIFAHSRSLA